MYTLKLYISMHIIENTHIYFYMQIIKLLTDKKLLYVLINDFPNYYEAIKQAELIISY